MYGYYKTTYIYLYSYVYIPNGLSISNNKAFILFCFLPNIKVVICNSVLTFLAGLQGHLWQE